VAEVRVSLTGNKRKRSAAEKPEQTVIQAQYAFLSAWSSPPPIIWNLGDKVIDISDPFGFFSSWLAVYELFIVVPKM